mgnify:FL=1
MVVSTVIIVVLVSTTEEVLLDIIKMAYNSKYNEELMGVIPVNDTMR